MSIDRNLSFTTLTIIRTLLIIFYEIIIQNIMALTRHFFKLMTVP